MNKKQKKDLTRVIAAICLIIVIRLLPVDGYIEFGLFMVPYLIVGHDILKKAVKGIMKGQAFDECFLMAVATVGAIALGDYVEGTAVMVFYQIGQIFESYAVGRSRRNISDLMDIRPDYANIENEDGEIEEVDPDDVEIGTIIVVKPGEKIPIDGVITEGRTTLDTAALTGESVPRDAHEGDEVTSGAINMSGLIRIRTTKEFCESTASKILDLVENASSRKSPQENFISKFARIYTPAVCGAALALAVIPPVISLITGNPAGWGTWVYRALTFLVISCPCALVISVPLTFFAGLGGASREGILIKGSNYMEALSKVKTVVFDKTGTLTQGVFEVNGVHDVNSDISIDDKPLTADRLLEMAACAESFSSHPIALSIMKAYGKPVDKTQISNIEEIGGHGVKVNVQTESGSVSVAVGNDKLVKALGISEFKSCEEAGTVVHVVINNTYAGHILISDRVKPESAEAIKGLKKIGIRDTIILTGDIRNVGESVAESLGVDRVFTELLPQDKVAKVEELLETLKGSKAKLAFVGDGINDAPVLTRADIGIAMGALGSDAAIEAADVVLMDDNPLKISKAVKISSKCMSIVYENIWFAIGIKFLCLILGAMGIANMWAAIFADVGVMVIAVLNAIRALNTKNL